LVCGLSRLDILYSFVVGEMKRLTLEWLVAGVAVGKGGWHPDLASGGCVVAGDHEVCVVAGDHEVSESVLLTCVSRSLVRRSTGASGRRRKSGMQIKRR
jgi:hypothetical protein